MSTTQDAEHAAMYRWLRAEHNRHDPMCHVVWKQNRDRASSEWVNTVDLDAAIRQAMADDAAGVKGDGNDS